ncbi:hypothetical protein [Lapillicoccus sp.]|uniref:hypothetical protein n=1 Tax=Lapillicoccus sp. TaxID=1909287 RepID=UPI0039839A01
MNRLRTTHLLLAAVAALALALTGCGAQDDTDSAADPATSQTSAPSAEAGGTLALIADGSATGKCAVPNAQTLEAFDTAFAGTVTSLGDDTVTLSVDQWYAGDEASTVTVAAPSQDLQDLLMAVDFQDGKSYLVSATDGRVTLCGYTAEDNPELQTIYDEAFGQ